MAVMTSYEPRRVPVLSAIGGSGMGSGSSFFTGAGAPPPARTHADSSLAALLGRQRRMAAGAHPTRPDGGPDFVRTKTSAGAQRHRRLWDGLGVIIFHWRWGPTPAAVARRFAPRNGSRLSRELTLTLRLSRSNPKSQIPFDSESRIPNPESRSD